MEIDKLRLEIEADEGKINRIYKCSLDHETFGIGHLIKQDDPEYGQPIGTEVSSTRVHEAFEHDVAVVINDCIKIYPNFYDFPEEAQRIIANMCFQLGRPRLSAFSNMRDAVLNSNWLEASVQMLDSRWAKQTPNRANRLADRMRAIDGS